MKTTFEQDTLCIFSFTTTKTSIAAEAMFAYIKDSMNGWSLPAHIEKYTEIDENNFASIVKSYCRKTSDNNMLFLQKILMMLSLKESFEKSL